MPFDGLLMDWEERLADEIARWRGVLSFTPRIRGTMDFETRSECDLKKRGSWLYGKHETTEAMCLWYRLPGQERRLWHMAHPQHLISESPPPLDLFAYILAGGLMEAHNAFFERMIWMHVMVARRGWPAMPHRQWRCSAAKACAASLPRKLEHACEAMHLSEQKDLEGHRLMMKMCKPRKMRKAEIAQWCEDNGWKGRAPGKDNPALPTVWHEEEDDIHRLWEYCRQDVVAEEGLSDALPDLSDEELEVWQMDQLMNERGARFDLDLAGAALDLADGYKARLNEELHDMTGVRSGTQRARVKDWLRDNEGVHLPDTKGETIDWLLKYRADELSGRARTVMGILRAVNRTSTRKYTTMLDKADPDDWRVRDLLMYYGAHTGRWTGKGVQVHNFPARDLVIGGKGQDTFEEAAELIKSRDVDWCIVMYDDVMRLVSHALRGAIIPDEGMELMVADYSAIEARCVLWLADARDALDVFRRGGDIYCDMATGIYGYEVLKATHKTERQFGKQSILGLGYGMGYVTFLLTCRKYDIVFSQEDVIRIMGEAELVSMERKIRHALFLNRKPTTKQKRDKNARKQAVRTRRRLEEARIDPAAVVHELALMKHTVNVYRERYPEVKQMWKDQEAAAIEATKAWQRLVNVAKRRSRAAWEKTGEDISFGPTSWETVQFRDAIDGPTVECGKIRWYVKGGWLHCELPSGRPIRYRSPRVKVEPTTWGEKRPKLTYMHVNGKTKKWERTGTYGGKLVENITQAVARDIMANAMVLAHRGGTYGTVMSVHDELVCEVGRNRGSIEDFEGLMSSIPPWAHGCPITAEAERMNRYKK